MKNISKDIDEMTVEDIDFRMWMYARCTPYCNKAIDMWNTLHRRVAISVDIPLESHQQRKHHSDQR